MLQARYHRTNVTMGTGTLIGSGLPVAQGSRRCTSCPQAAPRPARRHLQVANAQKLNLDPDAINRQMDAAKTRWDNNVKQGKVKSVSAKSAAELLKDGWTLLDVRPEGEFSRAAVKGAKHVPLYLRDEEKSPGALIKQMTHFGMGGWWEGGAHTKPNKNFLKQVVDKVPTSDRVLVTCQKGLRSLAATELLAKAGYQQLAWINGGYETSKGQELPVEGDQDIRMAGIGGLSALLGWTEVQQQTSKGFLGGGSNIIKGAIFILALDGVWFLYDQYMYFSSKQ